VNDTKYYVKEHVLYKSVNDVVLRKKVSTMLCYLSVNYKYLVVVLLFMIDSY